MYALVMAIRCFVVHPIVGSAEIKELKLFAFFSLRSADGVGFWKEAKKKKEKEKKEKESGGEEAASDPLLRGRCFEPHH